MNTLVALVFFVLLTSNYSIIPQAQITLDDHRGISRMYVFEKNKENHMLLSTSLAGKERCYYIVDSHGKTVFKTDTVKHGYQASCVEDDVLYYFDGVLKCVNLPQFTAADLGISDHDYTHLSVNTFAGKKILVAANKHFIDVIDFVEKRTVCRIQRKAMVRREIARYFEGNVIYNSCENEIAVFSIKENKILWTYSFGTMKGTFLGITLGRFDNLVAYLDVAEKQKEIYLSTFAGDLYRFDVLTGGIRCKVEHFSGTSNNAGLMPTFTLCDLNDDRIVDVVAPSVDHNLYAINGKDFTVIWQYDTDNENQLPVSLYDITGDKIPEVFNVNDYDRVLSVVNGKTGEKVAEIKLPKTKWFTQSVVCLADYNGDGKLELIVRNNGGEIGIWEMPDVSVERNKIIVNPDF